MAGLLLVGTYWLATDSFLTRRLLLGALERASGATISASSVTVTPFGRIAIEDLSVRAPDVMGQAGEIVRVRGLRAHVNLFQCARGNTIIYSLALDQPVARLSRSFTDGQVNIASLVAKARDSASLSPTPSAASSVLRQIPVIAISNGIIELGEHFPDTPDSEYVILKQLFMSGTVDQSADDTGASIISFRQADPSLPDTGKGLLAVGRISQEGVTLTVTGIELGALTPSNVPAQSRELVRDAAIEGRVPEAELSYNFAGSWTARIKLSGVALTLPLEAQPTEDLLGNVIPVPEAQRGSRLRLQKTDGQLVLSDVGMKGTLTGLIQSLPYEVSFEMQGTTARSPWTISLSSKDVLVHEQPEILKFAPGVVRRRLLDFSDPQGRVDASVNISRAAILDAANPPPLRVVGSVDLKGLTAAFHKFPYPFNNLRGSITFDDNEVVLHDIRGDGGNGSTVVANGTIRPPTDDAEVRVEVRVLDMPIDQTLRTAMDARGQGKVLDELFNADAYASMVARGLVRPTTTTQVNTSIPAFDLGGKANVGVLVTRAAGVNSIWNDRVEIEIPDAGMLLRALPYPMRARGIRIVQENGIAEVSGGTCYGLRGGSGVVRAILNLDSIQSSGEFVPDVWATARQIPVDDLLLAALPDIGPDDNRRPLSTLIVPLGPSGLVDASIELRDSPLGPEYDIRADITGTLRPAAPPASDGLPQPVRITVQDFSARVQVTESFVKMDAMGLARAMPTGPGAAIGANLFRRLNDFGPIAPTNELLPTDESLRVQAPKADLSLPIEDFVRGYSAKGANAIERTKADLKPAGVAEVDLRIDLSQKSAGDVDITLSRFRDATLVAKGLPIALDAGVPQLSRIRSDATGVRADYVFSGTLDDQPSGRIRVEGSLLQPSGDGDAMQTTSLRARDITIEQPSLLATLRASGALSVANTLASNEVSGVADADLIIEARGEQNIVTGTIRPRSLAFNASADDGSLRRVDFPRVSGQVRVRPTVASDGATVISGEVEGLALFARDWKGLVTGTWGPTREDQAKGTQIECQITLAAPSLLLDVRALLPNALGQAMSQLNTRVDGPVSIAQAPLAMILTPQGQALNVITSGSLALAGLSMDLGVPITHAEGVLDYRFSSEDQPGSGRASITGDFPVLSAANVALTQGRLSIFTEPDGRVIVPKFEARAHGGRITGTIEVGPSPAPLATEELASRRPFDLTLDLSSVRFAPLLAELRKRAGATGNSIQADNATIEPSSEVVADASRGALSGSFSLHGTLGDRSENRGRGTFTIEGGNILDLPTLVPLVRVTNLQLPIAEQLDQATADFFVLGTQVGLEQIAVSSKSVSLFGFGTATWPELNLDLRLRTGNRSRIPLLTEVIEQLRDELSSVRVQGPIDKPEIITERFSTTREALADLFGQPRSDDQRRLDMIGRSLSNSERRERADALPPIAPNPQ